MEIEGLIIRDLGETGGTSQRTGNPWRKHEWVMETIGQYPRKVKFDVFGDRCNTLTFEVGKSYVVQVDPESREFNERWYTDLRAYSARLSDNGNQMGVPVNPSGNVQQSQPVATNPFQQHPAAPANPFNNNTPDFSQGDSQDDLPF